MANPAGSTSVTLIPNDRDLQRQAGRHAFQAPLRGVIEPESGQREHAADRRHLDDVAVALAAQHGQRRLRHPQRAEQVRVDLPPRLLLGHLLDHAEQPVAGVVDDHVERTELAVRPGHGGERGVAVGDVEFDRQDGITPRSASGASALTSRAVATTESPRLSAASVHTRRNPRAAPVMSHVFDDIWTSLK